MTPQVMKATWTTSSRSIRLVSAVFISWILLLNGLGSCSGYQSFREVPESVQVKEGQDVFLRCAVDGQQGKVQWTKDGFALGFERHVPGYPRYAYSGDPSRGEHHLLINGVTLTEDGEYQCQVGPTDASPAIWAAANVTVLIPPRRLSITNWSDGGTIQVVGGNSLSLECVVSGGRPPATVWWYLGNTNLLTDQVIEEMDAPSVPRRWNVRSKVDLRVEAKDDRKTLSCEAEHPAFRDTAQGLSASLTLSVLHPPGLPVITGYKKGQIFREGERQNLSCRAPGGNPKPRVVWRREGRPVDTNSTFVDSVGVVNTYSMVPTKEDDGVQYECVVGHELLEEPLSANITLTVYYPPSYVSLTGPSQVEEGGSVWLTCESSESNPSSSLTWSVQGKEVTTAKSSVGQVSSGGWVTSSDLTQYVVRAGDLVPEITVECKASNPAFQKYASKTLVIAVTKPPGPPSWETDLGREVVSGATLDLSCSTVGGAPPPTLRIYKEDEAVPTQVEKRGNVTRARSLIKIRASDNGSKVTCEVSSPATRMPLTTSARLSVLFGPSETKGWMAPYQVEEGALFNLFCESSSSLPPSNITWDVEGMVVAEPSVDFYPAVFGGTSTRSQKQMRASAADDGRLVRCSAHNGIGPPATTNFTLHVLHAPIWIKEPSPQVNVQENSHVVIPALAKSNPGPPSYRWQRGEDLLGGRDELQLEKVRRSQSGNYSVSATNERGTVSASFFLNVQYGPEVLPPIDRVTVEGGGSVSVKCIARANPPARVIWSRTPHFQKSNKTQILSSGVAKAELVLRHIKPEDTGVYYCHAANLVGYSLPVKTKIIVLQAVTAVDNGNSISWSSPDVYGGGGSTSLASDGMALGVPAGGLGRLECLVKAAPQPTFVWSGRGGLILFKSDKYFIHEPQLVDGLVTWRSVLEIRRVTQEDFAQYKCSASNKLGSQTIPLSLTTPSHPQQPSNLNVARISSSAVSLTWTPDFSGGQPDGYTVKYRPAGDTRYQYAEVPGGHVTKMTVEKLLPDTEYSFTVQATNHFGTSPYSPVIYVHTLEGPSKEPTTLKEATQNASSSNSRFPGNWTQSGVQGMGGDGEGGGGGGGARTLTHARSGVPRLILLIMILTGTAFLIINTAIIACFVQRRSRNRRQRMVSSVKSSVMDLGEGTSGDSATSPNHGDVVLSLTTSFSKSFSRSPVFCQEDQQKTEETANFTTFSTISAPPLTPLLNGGVITSDTTLLTIGASRQQNTAFKQRSSFLSKSSADVVVDTLSATFAKNGSGGTRSPAKPEERVDYSSATVNYFPTELDACSQSSSVYDNASSPHLSTKNTSVRSDSSSQEEDDEDDDDEEEENEEEQEEEEEEEQDDLFSLRSISSNTSRTYRPSHTRPLVSSLGLRDELHVKCLPSPEVQLKVPTTDEVQHRLQEHIQKDLDLHKMQQRQQQQQQAAFAKSQEYSRLSNSGVNNHPTSVNFNARCHLSSFAPGSPPQYTTLQGLRLPGKAAQPRTPTALTNEYEYDWTFPFSGGGFPVGGKSSPLYEVVGIIRPQKPETFHLLESLSSVSPDDAPTLPDAQRRILQNELTRPSEARIQTLHLPKSSGTSLGTITPGGSTYRQENSGSSGYSSSTQSIVQKNPDDYSPQKLISPPVSNSQADTGVHLVEFLPHPRLLQKQVSRETPLCVLVPPAVESRHPQSHSKRDSSTVSVCRRNSQDVKENR